MKTVKVKFLILCFGLLLMGSCRKKPSAGFTVSDDNPVSNQTLNFTNNTANGESYEWDFGDGTYSNDENPTHSYAEFGNYTVSLKAYSKKEKKQDKYTKTIVVSKSTKEKVVNNWSYDSLRYNYYEDDILVNSDNYILAEHHIIHTIEFRVNYTYLTQLDADFHSGEWSLSQDGNVFSLDGDILDILELTENSFTFSLTDSYVSDGVEHTENTIGYLSR